MRNMAALSPKWKKIAGDVMISVLLLLVFYFNLFSYVEFKLQDSIDQKPTSVDPAIAVIGIDEEALDEFGKAEEWSRGLYADAINILNSSEEYRPAVIALDVLFVGERADAEADKALASAVQSGGNVIVAADAIIGDVQSPDDPSKIIHAVTGFEKPYPALAGQARYGVVNATFDGDSLIRGSTLKYQYGGETLYSFPYEIYNKYKKWGSEPEPEQKPEPKPEP